MKELKMKKASLFNKILATPFFYSISQKLMSATAFRKKIVVNFVKKKPSNILDIGCGPAEILENLKGISYYGFDINKNYIKSAKKNYLSNCSFFCQKFSANKIKKNIRFDYVLLLGLLHHLQDEEINLLLIEIKKVLKKKGKLLTLDNVYIDNQNFIAKKLINLDRGQHVRTKNEYIKLLKKNFKNVNTKIHHQNFIPYTWFVTKCSI